jgi:hypothetical protein
MRCGPRSRVTARAAAKIAAPIAMSAICQPGMPPVTMVCTREGGCIGIAGPGIGVGEGGGGPGEDHQDAGGQSAQDGSDTAEVVTADAVQDPSSAGGYGLDGAGAAGWEASGNPLGVSGSGCGVASWY